MERAGRDEEDVVGAYESVAGIDRGAFDDRKDVALHAFTADVRTVAGFPARDLVDFVEEHDAARFHAVEREARHLFHVNELLLLFLNQVFERFGDPHAAFACALAEEAGQHLLDVHAHFFDARGGRDFKRGRAVLDIDFHHALVEFAVAQALAELLAGFLVARFGVFGRGRHQQVEKPFLGVDFGAFRDFIQAFFTNHVDGDIDQVPDDRFHVAAHVADFGELAGFHLQERRVGEFGQPPGEFGFADTRGADHEDVFGHHFLGHLGRQFLAADAIAQCDRDGPLGFRLPNDVFIQFAYDFPRRQLIEYRRLIVGLAGKIDDHGLSQFLKGEVVVGIDADFGGDGHGLFDNSARRELGVAEQGCRGGNRERTTGAYRGDRLVGFDDVAVAADDEDVLGVGDEQQGFQVAQCFIRAPVFGQFDHRPGEVPVELF